MGSAWELPWLARERGILLRALNLSSYGTEFYGDSLFTLQRLGESGSANGASGFAKHRSGLGLRPAAPRRNRARVFSPSCRFKYRFPIRSASPATRPRWRASSPAIPMCLGRSREPGTLGPNSTELDRYRGHIATSRSRSFSIQTSDGCQARQQLAGFCAPRGGWCACAVRHREPAAGRRRFRWQRCCDRGSAELAAPARESVRTPTSRAATPRRRTDRLTRLFDRFHGLFGSLAGRLKLVLRAGVARWRSVGPDALKRLRMATRSICRVQ